MQNFFFLLAGLPLTNFSFPEDILVPKFINCCQHYSEMILSHDSVCMDCVHFFGWIENTLLSAPEIVLSLIETFIMLRSVSLHEKNM
jgi:hypothetical protein